MKNISTEKIIQTVQELAISACYELGEDVLAALKQAEKTETNPTAKDILQQLIENADIAKNERIPLCQDTGLAVVFIDKGTDVQI
jgi:fumarate hydratase subunit alpha